jgi:hypothetical protein
MEHEISLNHETPPIANVLLYFRSFFSFFVRRDKILLFNYQAVTKQMKNNYKNTCTVLCKCLYLYNN